MNFFSSDVFLTSLAEVYAPGHRYRIGLYRTEGRVFRLATIGLGRPITQWDFLDSLEPLEGAPESPVKPLRYVPLAVLRTDEVVEVPASGREGDGSIPAPYVDWSLFPNWDSFQCHYLKRRASLLRDSNQKRRHIERDLGPLVYAAHDTRADVFDRCIAWKSAQYLRTGVQDMFRRQESAPLFRTLEEKGALLISSLSAGETLLAVHFGALADRRFYSWIASYDPKHGHYSPGRLLLEEMLRDRQSRGDLEFDFGIGDSSYKWHYATHNRTIGPLGSPGLARVAARRARASIRHTLGHWPRLLERVRQARLRMRERGIRL